MSIRRIDHIGINVNDLPAAKAFFLDLGMEECGEAAMEGPFLSRVVALDNAKTEFVMLRTPDAQVDIELIKYLAPLDAIGVQPSLANTHGIRHICFEVEDLEDIITRLKAKGTELFSEIQNYENTYRLCYVRGPEGIILELAERVKPV